MSQAFGIMDVIVGGTTLDIEKGGKVTLGGYSRKPVLVQGKTHFCREYEASEITFTMPLLRGQSIDTIFAPDTAELQVNCDSGQSYIFPDAFTSNRPSFTAGEGGKIEVKLMAGQYQELLNG